MSCASGCFRSSVTDFLLRACTYHQSDVSPTILRHWRIWSPPSGASIFTAALIRLGEQVLLDMGLIARGEEIVILAGKTPSRETANLMKIHAVGERER